MPDQRGRRGGRIDAVGGDSINTTGAIGTATQPVDRHRPPPSPSLEHTEIVPGVPLVFKPRGGLVCTYIYFNKLLVSSKDVATGMIAAVQLQGSV